MLYGKMADFCQELTQDFKPNTPLNTIYVGSWHKIHHMLHPSSECFYFFNFFYFFHCPSWFLYLLYPSRFLPRHTLSNIHQSVAFLIKKVLYHRNPSFTHRNGNCTWNSRRDSQGAEEGCCWRGRLLGVGEVSEHPIREG